MIFGKGRTQAQDAAELAEVVKKENSPVVELELPTDRPDAIDRFFGFTEQLICSAGNTTNVELDPILLNQEEESRIILCGPRHAEMILQDEYTADACQQLLDKLAMNKAKETQKGLTANDSNDSGNTEADTLDGSTATSKSRRRTFFGFLSSCKGREVEKTVVVSATPRSTHYEITS